MLKDMLRNPGVYTNGSGLKTAGFSDGSDKFQEFLKFQEDISTVGQFPPFPKISKGYMKLCYSVIICDAA